MLSHILRSTGVPAFVKNASVDDDAPGDFSTRENTYLTYARTLIKSASADEQQFVWDHVKFWSIEKECKEFQTKLAELQQPWLLKDEAFCLLKKEASVRKYAAYDDVSTRYAAESFYENRASYPFEWRHETARNLLSKTAEYKVNLPTYVDQYLHKAACFGAADTAAIDEAMLIREQITPMEHAEKFNKVATLLEMLRDQPALRSDIDFLKEAMVTIDAFDAESNATAPLIEEIISDDLTLPSLLKQAADDGYNVKLTNGHEVDVRHIKKAALEAIDSNLASMDCEELAKVLPTLPRGDADLLSRLIG